MKPTEPVTVGGCAWRIAVGALLGAVITPAVWSLWILVRDQGLGGPSRPPNPFDFEQLAAVVLGSFFGLFFGAVGGWVWLVVTVGRESPDAARERHDTNHADEERGRLTLDPRQGNKDA